MTSCFLFKGETRFGLSIGGAEKEGGRGGWGRDAGDEEPHDRHAGEDEGTRAQGGRAQAQEDQADGERRRRSAGK